VKKLRTPDAEFDMLEGKAIGDFSDALTQHIRAIASANPERRDRSLDKLAVLFGDMMAWGDLLGRRRSVLEAEAVESRESAEAKMYFAERPMQTSARTPHRLPWRPYDVPGLTTVSFQQAAEDLATRVPSLAVPRGNEPLYMAVQRMYQTEHAFGLARAADLALTGRLETAMRMTATTQEALVRSMQGGLTGSQFETAMADMQGFSASYSEVVFRNNMKRAYTQGRDAQVQEDPVVGYVIPAKMYSAINDDSARGNHLACDGIVAPHDAPIWKSLSIPLGHNCRCSFISMSRGQLKRKGLLDEKTSIVKTLIPQKFYSGVRDPATGKTMKGGPDPGFGSGPGPQPYSGPPGPQAPSEAWQGVADRLGG